MRILSCCWPEVIVGHLRGEGLVDLLHAGALIDGILLQGWQLVVLSRQLVLIDGQTQLDLQRHSKHI